LTYALAIAFTSLYAGKGLNIEWVKEFISGLLWPLL
jgi:hypothetical protein